MIRDTPPLEDIPEPLPEIINQLEEHDLYVFPDRVYPTGIEAALVDEQHQSHIGITISENGERVRVSVRGGDEYHHRAAQHLADAYPDAYPGDTDTVEITQIEHVVEADGDWMRYEMEETTL